MSYSADISRTNPGCFIFLIDQSASMKTSLSALGSQTKMAAAADAVNRCLDAITQRCSQGDDIRDYFHIAIVGYSTNHLGKARIRSILDGTSPERPFLTISAVADLAEIEDRPVKEPDGAGGLVDAIRKFPVWVTPQAHHGTPMREAFSAAADAVSAWTIQNPDSFPPSSSTSPTACPPTANPRTSPSACIT